MTAKIARLKKQAIALFTLPLLAVFMFSSAPVPASSAQEPDVASTYKAKCAMCHGQKVEKFFDTAKTDDQHVEAVMKGVKGEKPPFMPAYEAKGVSADQAKALVAYMKSLKQ